jgi:hypothetical protein
LNNVRGCTQVALTVFGGIDQSLAPSDLVQGLSADNVNCAFLPGSVFTRPPLQRASQLPGTAQIIYAYSFTKPDGTQVLLEFTADGKMWADGAQIGQTALGNRFKCCTMFDRAYIAISDGDHGADVPLQYDGTYLERVSQDGPGAPPTFAATNILDDQYPIASITQPIQQSWNYASFLQSSGPGSVTPGNVVTIYYADHTAGAAYDADLVNAFNAGYPVYVFLNFTAGSSTFGPYVGLVTNAPTSPETVPGSGSGHDFFYFTFNVATSNYLLYSGAGHSAYNVTYQRTLGTVTTTVPVPDLIVGNNISISGTSAAAWNSSWSVAQTPNSGAVNISETQLTGGMATYSYSVVQGAPPVVGQEITITGLYNGPIDPTTGLSVLNVTNGVIATSTGGTSGSFTITGFEATTNYPASSESGSGITAGTKFCIDPGVLVVNTATSPIYGSATGGYLFYAGSTAAIVAPGQRQGCVFFLRRSGNTTAPSPVASFSVPANCNAITVANLPIGPSDVIARYVAFTGANGGTFFYLPAAPQLSGVVYGTSTAVNDNVTTNATFYFTDQALFAGTEIDIPGNDLFNQIVLSGVLGFFPYAGRLFSWGERNKVQAFLNMGFEGGVIAFEPNVPLGWKVTGTGTLGAGDYGLGWSPNGSASLSQTAYQNQNGSPILIGQTQYTFRCWVNGSATATLSSVSQGFSVSATVNAVGNFAEADFSGMTPQIVPSDYVLTITGTGTMDELEIVYTANPYLQSARASYINNPEAFDGVTGIIGPANDPHEIRSMYLRRDVLHMLTYGPDGSLYETQDTASGEPVTWQLNQLSALCGAISVWGDAQFEDWQIWASDTGLRIYDGGDVEKMSEEVQTWWNSFNQAAWNLTCVENDSYTRRIYVGGVTGSSLAINEWYSMDYRELNTAAAMSGSTPLKIGISGKMLTTDLTRKWSPWGITANFGAVLNGVMTFCGGGSLAAGTLYTLDEGNLSGVDDDYGWFDSYYCTYFMLTADEAQALKLSANRKLFIFMTLNINGVGFIQSIPLLDDESNPGRPSRALALRAISTFDLEIPLNLAADRVSFKIAAVLNGGAQAGFSLSSMTVSLKDHPYSVVRGWNGGN